MNERERYRIELSQGKKENNTAKITITHMLPIKMNEIVLLLSIKPSDVVTLQDTPIRFKPLNNFISVVWPTVYCVRGRSQNLSVNYTDCHRFYGNQTKSLFIHDYNGQ